MVTFTRVPLKRITTPASGAPDPVATRPLIVADAAVGPEGRVVGQKPERRPKGGPFKPAPAPGWPAMPSTRTLPLPVLAPLPPATVADVTRNVPPLDWPGVVRALMQTSAAARRLQARFLLFLIFKIVTQPGRGPVR
jgi:hypothetical protein